MKTKFLTTGQAARRCMVTADTILKWIRSGLLPARRTVGGHHRINERDLTSLMPPADRLQEKSHRRPVRKQFRYCWEYNGNGKLLESCTGCAVYLMRAQRCYQVAKLAPQAGHPKTFCKETCQECDYYRQVHEQTTNVLVITDDTRLTCDLKANASTARFNLEFADCEYTCSAAIHGFRADFAVVDCSLGSQKSRDIASNLVEDPRVPFVRVVLAGNEGEFPNECEKMVFARIERPFGIKDIQACIQGIKSDHQDPA